MDTAPYKEDEIPPRGYTLGRYPDGTRFWFRPTAAQLSIEKRSVLTKEQRERVKRFKEVIGKHDSMSLEDAFHNFEHDRNPESEIRVWEIVAEVYRAEIAERGVTTARERGLVYKAALCCSLTRGTVDDLLAADPEFKGLSNLARLVERYRNLNGMTPELQRAREQLDETAARLVQDCGMDAEKALDLFAQAYRRFQSGRGPADEVLARYREVIQAVTDAQKRARLLEGLSAFESFAREIQKFRDRRST
jgi:hypothetical protein